MPLQPDPNPILDEGCPRSAGGINSAIALCLAMGIDFEMEPLDCEPFYHGYGEKCREAELTIGIWKLHLTDLKGNEVVIPFYITKGSGILLLGNIVLSKSDIMNTKDILRVPAGVVRGLKTEVSLPIYTTGDSGIRTHLHVVPSQMSKFRSYFASYHLLYGSNRGKGSTRKKVVPRFMGETAKEFARKLHLYSHLPLRDMKDLCKRGGILVATLKQALEAVVEKCTSCKETGRPLNVRKTSLNKLLRSFNDEVQIDFMWITELTKSPVLHMKDNAAGLCAAVIMNSWDMDEAKRAFEQHWITVHGPPLGAAYYPEFDNSDFGVVLERHGIEPKPRPARKHSKIGSLESGNTTLRKLSIRLLKDAQHEKDRFGVTFTKQEILSKAVLACNLLRGRKKLCAFELARGYMPSIAGLSKTLAESAIVDACYEQIIRRALTKVIHEKSSDASKRLILSPKTKVYFYEKKGKQGVWKTGFVQKPKEHFVELTRGEYGRGKRLKIAYEDIRLFPSSSLLEELDQIELDEEGGTLSSSLEGEEDDTEDTPAHSDSLPDDTNSKTDGRIYLNSLLGGCERNSDYRKLDFLISTPTNNPLRDTGGTTIEEPKKSVEVLKSQEQEILRQLRDIIGDEPVTESKLQFAPRWIIDKSIRSEKDNYTEKKAYQEVNIRSLPKGANLISSHCFFQIKYDGESTKLKLKCRLVPHGNRDKEKDNIRKDSSTAQFPVIRALLSAAVLLQFRLATIEISGAFLQSGPIRRDVYIRLPKGWSRNAFTVWKLLVPAYRLVESDRLWQLAVEEWMVQNGILPVEGMTQIFTKRNENGDILLIIAKVVDDFLIAGLQRDIDEFNEDISKRFKVGRFVFGPNLIFNRLHIHQDSNFSVSVSMEEYIQKIESIPIDRKRRKEQDSKCTLEELKLLQALAGQLNWLGHGVVPPAAYVSSLMQQWTGDLRVKDLCEANRALHEVRKLQPVIRYKCPTMSETKGEQAVYLAFSDASQGKGAYGQTGYVSGTFFPDSKVYHILEWHSSKQCRVSFSSSGAEILAAAESADRASLMCYCLHRMYGSNEPLPLVLTVDSHGLYSTITTLHEGRDYRLRPTVARLRDSFETREISVLQWIKGTNNIVDALTKRNLDTFKKINGTCVSGQLSEEILLQTERVTYN